jgi:hypothetical protein
MSGLPCVIPCSGDGSFSSPYRIDLEDPLTAVRLAMLGPDFHSITVGLNNVLRAIRGPSLSVGLQRSPPSDSILDDEEIDEADAAGDVHSGSLNRGDVKRQRLARKLMAATTTTRARALLQCWSCRSIRRLITCSRGPLVPIDLNGYASLNDAGVAGRNHGLRSKSFASTPLQVAAAAEVEDADFEYGDIGRRGGAVGGSGAVSSAWLKSLTAHAVSHRRADLLFGLNLVNHGMQLEGQSALKVAQDYLTVVNDTLSARSAAAASALDALERKRHALPSAQAQHVLHQPLQQRRDSQSTVGSTSVERPVVSAKGSNASLHAHHRPDQRRHRSSSSSLHGEIDVSQQLSSRNSFIDKSAAAGERPDDNNTPFSVEAEEAHLAEALRWVSVGFPGYEPGLWLGKMSPVGGAGAGEDTVSSQLCLLMLPRNTPPAADGSWPFYLPYNAQPLRSATVAPFVSPLAARFAGAGSVAAAADVSFGGSTTHSIRASSAPGTTNSAAFSSVAHSSGLQSDPRLAGGGAPELGRRGVCAQRYDATCGLTNWVLGPLTLLIPTLANRRAFASLAFATFTLGVCVLADLILSALFLSLMASLVSGGALVMIAVPPLVFVLCPLVGLLAVARRSAALQRVHAAFVQASICATFIGFFFAVANVGTDTGLTLPLAVTLPLLLLITKWLEVPAAHARVAHLDLQHDGDRWRPEAVSYAREWFIHLRGLDSAAAGGGGAGQEKGI